MKTEDLMCPHDVPLSQRTRLGTSACPFCRRTQRAQDAKRARTTRAAGTQPVLDIAMLRAGETDDDAPGATILPFRARRRATRWVTP